MIVIYSLAGGQGKTHLSLALSLELGYGVVTNNQYSKLKRVLDLGEKLKILEPGEHIPKSFANMDIIVDLGGYPDEVAGEILKMAKWVIVPVINEYNPKAECIQSIQEFLPFNKNIIVVANRTKTKKSGGIVIKDDFEDIKKAVQEQFRNNIAFYQVKETRAIQSLLEPVKVNGEIKPPLGISIRRLADLNKLNKRNYGVVADQLDLIINHITK